jgi:putative hydrolase of the HAD superfamily
MSEAPPGVGDGAPVPVVLFDLDNTLFDRATAYRRWATEFVAGTGLASDDVEWFVDADQDGFASRSDVWAEAQRRFGLTGDIEELVASYRASYLDCCSPDNQVHGSLRTLRASGWRIGIVTNGAMPQQKDKATRLGLLPLVDGFCASAELAIAKPDPRIFEETIRRCADTSPSAEVRAVWMVGDAPEADRGGGRALGLKTMWLHRGRAWDMAHGATPTMTVGSVHDAVSAILSASTA